MSEQRQESWALRDAERFGALQRCEHPEDDQLQIPVDGLPIMKGVMWICTLCGARTQIGNRRVWIRPKLVLILGGKG